MNVELLERAVVALGPLLSEVTFVGGATVGQWLSDEAAPGARPTNDVDVVVELASKSQLDAFGGRLRERQFREDFESGVICRWLHGDRLDPLVVDVMPTESAILGFANVWQARGIPFAQRLELPSGAAIRAIPPPYLVATKLEAFRGRGKGDFGASHDLEDVISLVDGRPELVDECRAAASELREYVATEVRALLAEERFVDTLGWHLRPDSASQGRLSLVVLPRLKRLSELA